jgi:putative solute:sodium symporter small subunit
VRDSSEASWWRLTWQTAAATAGGATVLALVAAGTEADTGGPQMFGLPLGEFFALIGLPVAIAIAAFVFASRQQALDRRFDVAED